MLFQFQNGAIKSERYQLRRYSQPSFNSKMVRLKENWFDELPIESQMFQFQNGAIKR